MGLAGDGAARHVPEVPDLAGHAGPPQEAVSLVRLQLALGLGARHRALSGVLAQHQPEMEARRDAHLSAVRLHVAGAQTLPSQAPALSRLLRQSEDGRAGKKNEVTATAEKV